jgi:uroporphyrin-3 C-methyltransferase
MMAVDEKEPGKALTPESEPVQSEDMVQNVDQENTASPATEHSEVTPAAAEPEETRLHETKPPRVESPPRQKTSAFMALLVLLALLLGVAALGLSGWQYYQQTQQAVEPDSSQDAELAQLKTALAADQRQRQQARSELQQSLQADIKQLQQGQNSQLKALEQTLQQQRERLLALDGTDRADWLLAEVEYLLRLANQRLVMASDVRSAKALLMTADGIVKELDDASLHGLRAAISADLATLRGIPEVDVEGIWLRIQALVGQVDRLVLFELPEFKREAAVPGEDSGWRERMQQGVKAALDRLSSYIVIRRRETPYEAMLDPQWEGMVRQNLRMLLEQSRAALLSGNQTLYRESLANSQRWLGEFFSFNEGAVAAVDAELTDLLKLDIEPGQVDLSQSLAAAKVAINEKHQVGGEQ